MQMCVIGFAIQLKRNEVPLRIAYFALSEDGFCLALLLACYIHYTKLNKPNLDKSDLKDAE